MVTLSILLSGYKDSVGRTGYLSYRIAKLI
jgi:hypothetical protein